MLPSLFVEDKERWGSMPRFLWLKRCGSSPPALGGQYPPRTFPKFRASDLRKPTPHTTSLAVAVDEGNSAQNTTAIPTSFTDLIDRQTNRQNEYVPNSCPDTRRLRSSLPAESIPSSFACDAWNCLSSAQAPARQMATLYG